jgi:hypothetical protein
MFHFSINPINYAPQLKKVMLPVPRIKPFTSLPAQLQFSPVAGMFILFLLYVTGNRLSISNETAKIFPKPFSSSPNSPTDHSGL